MDKLKHFYNIQEFYEQIKERMKKVKSNEYALVSLDFDNFNFINDLFSYEIGDKTLRKMEEHFEKKLIEGECFARIHADHFVFWVKNDENKSLLKRFYEISDLKKSVVDILPAHYSFVCSGGIVYVNNALESITSLLDKANFARKQAKGNYVSTFLYYNKKMEDELKWKKIITLTMEEALINKEFEMYLQPKILIQNDKIVGAEALVRWNSKKYGLIYPDKFIPVLEENGFIKQLDFFMLEQACLFLKKSVKENLPVLPISVNFSKMHIRTFNFVDRVFEIVNNNNIPTHLIEIELTESVFSDDFDKLVIIIGGLKNLGFKVSLDDFGRAYSSLNCLKDLPLDIIKIDKGFLSSSTNTDKGRIIISKMVELIKSLKLISVMEGVENHEQVNFLQGLNCDLGQGYFYAKPMTIDNYIDFIMNNDFLNEFEDIFDIKKNRMHLNEEKEFQVNNLKSNALEKHINQESFQNKILELEGIILEQRKKYEELKISEEKYKNIIEKSECKMHTLTLKSQLDPLTKLYNKEETHRLTKEYIENNRDKKVAFFMLDVDNFKSINDNLGHQFGDAVLKEVSQKVKDLFKDTDIVGRLGGDELGICMCDIDDEVIVCKKAEELLSAMRITYFGSDKTYDISASIGIACYPKYGESFDDLYHFADVALYESKRSGKDCYTIYQNHMTGSLKNNRTPVEFCERFLNSYFANDQVYPVFEMLYETKDIKITMKMILELIGKKFNVDRVYIFENSEDNIYTSNTYEWCASGISPEIDNLQNLSTKMLSKFFDAYNNEGILCCNDINDMDPVTIGILNPQGIKSLLHCAIFDEGEMMGFIGFDSCKEKRLWSGNEIATLGYISRILSVFLMKKQMAKELLDSYENYVEMLDNLNGYVYVIDINTYEILYFNNSMKELGANIGDKCHNIAFYKNIPCENCPVRKLTDEKPYAIEKIYSIRVDGWIISAASKLKWIGREDVALIWCMDITKYIQDKELNSSCDEIVRNF